MKKEEFDAKLKNYGNVLIARLQESGDWTMKVSPVGNEVRLTFSSGGEDTKSPALDSLQMICLVLSSLSGQLNAAGPTKVAGKIMQSAFDLAAVAIAIEYAVDTRDNYENN